MLLPSLSKLFGCLILTLGLAAYGLAQNVNSSTKKPTKKQTKQTTKPQSDLDGLDLSGLDLSGVDELLRQQKEWPNVAATSYSSVYYGAKTVRRMNANVVRVWTKTTLKDDTEQAKSEFLRNRRAQRLSVAAMRITRTPSNWMNTIVRNPKVAFYHKSTMTLRET